MNAHTPRRIEVSESDLGTLITADASKVSPREFFRAVFAKQIARAERDKLAAEQLRQANEAGDNKRAAEILLQGVADHLGAPLSELREKGKWL